MDLKWLCSVGTCIVDVLVLYEYCYAFCHLKKSGRLFIVKPKANTPSVIRVFGWECIVDVFSFDTRCQSVNLLREIINCESQSNTLSLIGALSKKLCSGVV